MINENQIRCTLTREDLISRHLKISELAYGSEKAKLLFREMMQQAAADYGFVADDIPLMIEAIPMSSESIVLIITKVSDPEELDTRFSKFTPYRQDEDEDEDSPENLMADMEHIHSHESPEDIINFFRQLYERLEKGASASKTPQQHDLFGQFGTSVIATFPDLESITKLAQDLGNRYQGRNSLFQAPGSHEYTLVMEAKPHTQEEFNRFCFLLPEYGTPHVSIESSDAHILEHYRPIIKNDALQVLAEL